MLSTALFLASLWLLIGALFYVADTLMNWIERTRPGYSDPETGRADYSRVPADVKARAEGEAARLYPAKRPNPIATMILGERESQDWVRTLTLTEWAAQNVHIVVTRQALMLLLLWPIHAITKIGEGICTLLNLALLPIIRPKAHALSLTVWEEFQKERAEQAAHAVPQGLDAFQEYMDRLEADEDAINALLNKDRGDDTGDLNDKREII